MYKYLSGFGIYATFALVFVMINSFFIARHVVFAPDNLHKVVCELLLLLWRNKNRMLTVHDETISNKSLLFPTWSKCKFLHIQCKYSSVNLDRRLFVPYSHYESDHTLPIIKSNFERSRKILENFVLIFGQSNFEWLKQSFLSLCHSFVASQSGRWTRTWKNLCQPWWE